MLPKSVYITLDVVCSTSLVCFPLSFLCCCFQLLSDSRPHWHTTGKELKRPVLRHPISRGGAFARPSAAATFDQSRRRPTVGAVETLDADWPPAQVLAPRPSARPDVVTCGTGDKSFQSYRNICVWARNGDRTIMREQQLKELHT